MLCAGQCLKAGPGLVHVPIRQVRWCMPGAADRAADHPGAACVVQCRTVSHAGTLQDTAAGQTAHADLPADLMLLHQGCCGGPPLQAWLTFMLGQAPAGLQSHARHCRSRAGHPRCCSHPTTPPLNPCDALSRCALVVVGQQPGRGIPHVGVLVGVAGNAEHGLQAGSPDPAPVLGHPCSQRGPAGQQLLLPVVPRGVHRGFQGLPCILHSTAWDDLAWTAAAAALQLPCALHRPACWRCIPACWTARGSMSAATRWNGTTPVLRFGGGRLHWCLLCIRHSTDPSKFDPVQVRKTQRWLYTS